MKLGNLRRNPAETNAEAGYLLIVIMIMIALLAIASLAHVQNLVTELKRDREEELVHRGAQYARAVKKYYKKFNQYPVSLDQLEKTNNMRFLRKRYKDPITGGAFRLVRQMDFLANQMGAGGPVSPGSISKPPDNISMPPGNISNPPDNISKLPDNISMPPDDGNPKPLGGSGPTFGGGPFVGVASTSPKVSLKEFDKKNHYKDWLFVYVPSTIIVVGANGPVGEPLIKGPFVRSQLTGGVGGQNQPLFPNQPIQPNQGNSPTQINQPPSTSPLNQPTQGNQTNP
jgi:type II secretory pathway pseudopilin PulG